MIEVLFGWSAEYRHWGWNALTVSAIATFAFTLFQSWALVMQARGIWKNKKGESVSVTWVSLFCFTFLSFTVYGMHQKSMAMIVNGLQGLLLFPILFGLWKFKRIAVKEHVVTVAFVFMLPAMIVLPQKAMLLLVFMGVANCSLLVQFIEIWRNEKVGVVDIRVIWTYLASTGFWIAYASALGDFTLVSLMIMAFLFLCFIAGAYYTYRDKQADPAS